MSKELNESLAASKRNLQLLTARRKLLEDKIVFWEQQEYQGVGSQPFFYSAIGADGEAGVEMQRNTTNTLLFQGVWNDVDFLGKANVQEDAVFVWTHVGITLRILQDATEAASLDRRENLALTSRFRTAPELDVGFVDKSSGRVLFQSERRAAGESQAPAGKFGSSIMDMNKQQVESGIAPGHGSVGLWALPKEVVLPSSTSVEVQLQTPFLPDADFNLVAGQENYRYRAYITLGGYKVTS